MNTCLMRFLAMTALIGMMLAATNCASEEDALCGPEDALCTLLLLNSGEATMRLTFSNTDLGGAGEGDTVTVNIYAESDTSCSGTATKTYSFSVSTFLASGSQIVDGSGLPTGTHNIRMTRGSTNSNCDSFNLVGTETNYYCTVGSTTLVCN